MAPSAACTALRSMLPFLVPSERLWGTWEARGCMGPVCRAHGPADQPATAVHLGQLMGEYLCCSQSRSGPVLSASEWPPGPSILWGKSHLHLLDAVDGVSPW